MAFDFLGTFTKSQFDRFSAFVRAQVQLIDGRIAHLKAEQVRVGNLAFAFDQGGAPTGMAADPPTTYCGKLFGVYEALGGDAQFDLQVRSTGQGVFLLKGDETTLPQMMSSGDIVGGAGLSDAETSELMGQTRSWAQDTLLYRREALERKIRRAIDYTEQLQTEINQLTAMKADVTVNGSLEFLIAGINQFVGDSRYFAASDDTAQPDPYGKKAYSKIAAYEPGPDRTEVDNYERTYGGETVPQGNG